MSTTTTKATTEITPSSAGQYIVSRVKPRRRELDPYDIKNVYRSQEDIDRAIEKNTFTYAKTMHMNYTTKNIFWLCYDTPTPSTPSKKVEEVIDV